MPITPEMITAISVALFAISEVLAFIPQIKANSVFQLLYNMLKREKQP